MLIEFINSSKIYVIFSSSFMIGQYFPSKNWSGSDPMGVISVYPNLSMGSQFQNCYLLYQSSVCN